MSIGLKGSWERTKGCRLRHRLRDLIYNIKYSLQRVWRGWDDRDVFALNDMFVKKYIEILKDFRKHNNGLWRVPEEYITIFDKLFFNEEETNAIIDTMIYHLEMTDEDYVEKQLYGKNIYDADYDFEKDFSIEKCKHAASVAYQNKVLFMELFDLFFFDLWY